MCARCLTEWIQLRGSFCPYCYDTSPLECTQLKPASRMLLNDMMVSCASCKRNVRAADYDTHTCTDEVNKEEMQLVHTVVHRMLNASKENCIHIPTGGTVSDNQYRLLLLFNLHLQPLTLARVTVPKAPITQLSKRTRKRRVLELQHTRNILSGSSDDSGILLRMKSEH